MNLTKIKTIDRHIITTHPPTIIFDKKRRGAFFTSNDVAQYLVGRVITEENQIILEPSFGDGSFIEALIKHYHFMGWGNSLKNNLNAIDIQDIAISHFGNNPFVDTNKFILGDFINIEPFPIDVVIGNPPYVGLNKLPDSERARAQRLLSLYGFKMQSSGSLWFPFILHSCAFLKNNGAIAFVVPFEITYVKYSKQLWKYLSQHFSELSIIRVYEDIFPNVDVETVLFIAKGYGGSTNFVNYEIYESKMDLLKGITSKKVNLSIESILNGGRPFVASLLNAEHLKIIQKLRSQKYIKPISNFCKFKIGYVSGDKVYFHPANTDIKTFHINKNALIPSVVNAKVLKKNIGLEIKANQIQSKLFYPNEISRNHPYIKYGEKQSVHQRFKCRHRKPWYITPDIEIPDVILTVFGDCPRMYINSGKYLASNSLLCGFIKDKTITKKDIPLSWYNSLTLLSIELKVHSLGGGVLVFIPGETDNIEVLDPKKIKNIKNKFSVKIEHLLKRGLLKNAYMLGDEYFLKKMGLSQKEILQIRQAIRILQKWRNTKLRRCKTCFDRKIILFRGHDAC